MQYLSGSLKERRFYEIGEIVAPTVLILCLLHQSFFQQAAVGRIHSSDFHRTSDCVLTVFVIQGPRTLRSEVPRALFIKSRNLERNRCSIILLTVYILSLHLLVHFRTGYSTINRPLKHNGTHWRRNHWSLRGPIRLGHERPFCSSSIGSLE